MKFRLPTTPKKKDPNRSGDSPFQSLPCAHVPSDGTGNGGPLGQPYICACSHAGDMLIVPGESLGLPGTANKKRGRRAPSRSLVLD